MNKCPSCGKLKDEKYNVCAECNEKNKGKDPVVDQLEKINNNIYKVSVQLGVILEENYQKKVEWKTKKQLKAKFGNFVVLEIEEA